MLYFSGINIKADLKSDLKKKMWQENKSWGPKIIKLKGKVELATA